MGGGALLGLLNPPPPLSKDCLVAGGAPGWGRVFSHHHRDAPEAGTVSKSGKQEWGPPEIARTIPPDLVPLGGGRWPGTFGANKWSRTSELRWWLFNFYFDLDPRQE